MGSGKSSDVSDLAVGARTSRRRWLTLAVLFVIGVACLPHVIARTSLRDKILSALIGDSDLAVSSNGASFGWLSPLTIEQFELRSSQGDVAISIASIEAGRSWFSLWVGQEELGTILVTSPRVELVVEGASSSESPQLEGLPELTAVIRDGSLTVRESKQSEPVIDASEIDLTLHLTKKSGAPFAVVDAITLAEHEPLSTEACAHGLQLVAPVLVDEIKLSGEYTLEILKARLPLDGKEPERRAVVEGELKLHHVNAEFTNEVTQRVILVMTELMKIDDVPETIRLIDDATITFVFEDERVHHEASAEVLPNLISGLSVTTKGDVGLDERLDVTVSIVIPFDSDNETRLAKDLSRTPIDIMVRGTAESPLLEIPDDQPFIMELHDRIREAETTPDEKRLGQNILNAIAELEGKSP